MRMNTWAALAIVLLVQTGVLGWMVVERMRLLQSGREIVLKTEPVDPRSLFRGDYVSLQLRRLTRAAGSGRGDREWRRALRHARGEGRRRVERCGGWDHLPGLDWPRRGRAARHGRQYVARKYERADPGALRHRELLRAGRRRQGARGQSEDQRPAASSSPSSDTGKAAIKGLVLDGSVRYDEPLF